MVFARTPFFVWDRVLADTGTGEAPRTGTGMAPAARVTSRIPARIRAGQAPPNLGLTGGMASLTSIFRAEDPP